MSRSALYLSGVERTFGSNEIIVSKTDATGRIIYANEVFLRMAGFSESEILRQPHSIIRHPDMPRSIFKLLWDTISSGKEIFAYVKNRAKNGDHYWVLAHVTPTYGADGTIISYHSNRRAPPSRSHREGRGTVPGAVVHRTRVRRPQGRNGSLVSGGTEQAAIPRSALR